MCEYWLKVEATRPAYVLHTIYLFMRRIVLHVIKRSSFYTHTHALWKGNYKHDYIIILDRIVRVIAVDSQYATEFDRIRYLRKPLVYVRNYNLPRKKKKNSRRRSVETEFCCADIELHRRTNFRLFHTHPSSTNLVFIFRVEISIFVSVSPEVNHFYENVARILVFRST